MKLAVLKKSMRCAPAARKRWGNFELIRRDPYGGMAPGACWNNVERFLAIEGGEPVVGWALRVWKNRFIEGECHCVVRIDGSLLDPTPHPFGEMQTAFSESSDAAFDQSGFSLCVNEYVNVAPPKDRGMVDKLIAVSVEKQALEMEMKSQQGLSYSLDSENGALLAGYIGEMRSIAHSLGAKF